MDTRASKYKKRLYTNNLFNKNIKCIDSKKEGKNQLVSGRKDLTTIYLAKVTKESWFHEFPIKTIINLLLIVVPKYLLNQSLWFMRDLLSHGNHQRSRDLLQENLKCVMIVKVLIWQNRNCRIKTECSIEFLDTSNILFRFLY